MMERCPAVRFHRDERTGRLIGLVEAQTIDTVLLHAPRADTAGNVEIYGARALDLPIVGAARQVLVTVEEIVPAGTLRSNGRQTIITRNLVTAIAEVPGGAYPTSCLPYYATDYARIREILDGEHGSLVDALQRPADAPSAMLRQAAKVPAEKVVPAPFRSGAPAPEAPTTDELMAVRIARMLDNESFASAGAVSPLGNVAYRLAKATHAPDLFIGTFSCGHVDVAAGTMTLTLLEAMDSSSAVAHCGGDDTYSTYYQAGHRDARDHRRGADRCARADQQSRADQAVGRQAQAAGAGRHVGRRQHAPELRRLRAAPWPGVAGRERRDGELGARRHFRRGAAGGGLSAGRHLARHQPLRLPLRRGGRAAGGGRDHAGRQRARRSPRRPGFKVIFADDCKPMDAPTRDRAQGPARRDRSARHPPARIRRRAGARRAARRNPRARSTRDGADRFRR